MKTKMNVLIILLTLCGVSCGDFEKFVDHAYSIRVQNNSKDTILYYKNYNYPDTSIDQKEPELTRINPNDYSQIYSKKEWEDVLIPPKDTLSLFIFCKDTIDKYNWSEIKINYKILKRYDLSLDDLKSQKWVITYP